MADGLIGCVEFAFDCALMLLIAGYAAHCLVRPYRIWRHGEVWYHVTERRRVAFERLTDDIRSHREGGPSIAGIRPFSLRRAIRGRGHPHGNWSHLRPPPGRRFPVWRAFRRFAQRHPRIFGRPECGWYAPPESCGKSRRGC